MGWIVIPIMIIAIAAIASDTSTKNAKYRSQSGVDAQELQQLLDQLRDEHAALHQELAAIDEKVSSIEKMIKEV